MKAQMRRAGSIVYRNFTDPGRSWPGTSHTHALVRFDNDVFPEPTLGGAQGVFSDPRLHQHAVSVIGIEQEGCLLDQDAYKRLGALGI